MQSSAGGPDMANVCAWSSFCCTNTCFCSSQHAAPLSILPATSCGTQSLDAGTLPILSDAHKESAHRCGCCSSRRRIWCAAWTSMWTCGRAGIATGATYPLLRSCLTALTGRSSGCASPAALFIADVHALSSTGSRRGRSVCCHVRQPSECAKTSTSSRKPPPRVITLTQQVQITHLGYELVHWGPTCVPERFQVRITRVVTSLLTGAFAAAI